MSLKVKTKEKTVNEGDGTLTDHLKQESGQVTQDAQRKAKGESMSKAINVASSLAQINAKLDTLIKKDTEVHKQIEK